jgi:hypothetical protein
MNDTPDPLDQPEDEEALETTPRASTSRFKAAPLIIVAVLVTILAFIQPLRKAITRAGKEEAAQQEAAIANSTVGLTVEWNSDDQLPLFEVKWTPGMTVRDLMLDAQKAGRITFEESGEDDAAMLTAISGTKNEGGSTDSFNWTFRVNGKMGDKSFAIYKLQKGDIVIWKFGPYE